MFKHAVSIKWSDEDHGFIAVIPGVEGLSAFGKTQDEALSELKIAAEAFFKALKKAGHTAPDIEKIQRYSGQFRLRLPKRLHAHLVEAAENDGVSLNTYIVALLAKRSEEENLLRKIDDSVKRLVCSISMPYSGSSNFSSPELKSPSESGQDSWIQGRPN